MTIHLTTHPVQRFNNTPNRSRGRGIQVFYMSRSINTTVLKYKLQVKVQKYPNQNIFKVPKVKVLIVQNGPFQNNLQVYYYLRQLLV